MTVSQAGVSRTRDLLGLERRLANWLSDRMPDASDVEVRDLGYPRGAGLSNETIMFRAAWLQSGQRQEEGFVLRLEPQRHRYYLELDFRGQFDLQRALGEEGKVRVPEMAYFEEDPTIFGTSFFLMKRREGRVAISNPSYVTTGWIANATSADRRRIWENGVRALASVHFAAPATLCLLDKPHYGATGWEQEWNYWLASHRWARGERALPTCDAIIAWLEANRPANRPSGLCWGDARLGNLMYDENLEVSMVMDWEGASLGGNLQDLGYWLFLEDVMTAQVGFTPDGFGRREETIALWEDVTGASAADVAWYEVFAGLKMATLMVRRVDLEGNAGPGCNHDDNLATRILADRLALRRPASAP